MADQEYDPTLAPRWLGDEIEPEQDVNAAAEQLLIELGAAQRALAVYDSPGWPAFEHWLGGWGEDTVNALGDKERTKTIEDVRRLQGIIAVIDEALDKRPERLRKRIRALTTQATEGPEEGEDV